MSMLVLALIVLMCCTANCKCHCGCSLFSSLGICSAINDILDRDEFTLEELLVEDELLQEIKSKNGRLIEV